MMYQDSEKNCASKSHFICDVQGLQSESKPMLQLTVHSILLLKNIWNQEVRLIHFNMCLVNILHSFYIFSFLSNKMGTFC